MNWIFPLALFLSSGLLRAELKVEPEALDLGRRAQEQVVTQDVKLTNAGKETLEIKSVAADCSCTAGTPEKRVLAPGESTALKITLQTRTYQGQIFRRVLVDTSQGEVVVPVKVFVTIYEHWSFSPYPAIMTPTTKGESGRSEVTITYSGDTPAEVKSLSSSQPWLKAEIVQHEQNQYKVALIKGPEAPAGNHSVRITAETTDAQAPQLAFAVFVPVPSTVHLNPMPIVLPPTKVGQRTALNVTLTGWDANTPPETELQDGEVKILEKTGDGFVLDVSLTPKSSGSFTQLLRVFADKKLEAEIPVVVRVEP